jgi:hypothetical protein
MTMKDYLKASKYLFVTDIQCPLVILNEQHLNDKFNNIATAKYIAKNRKIFQPLKIDKDSLTIS